MKIVKLFFFLLFLPVFSFCQSLTGLWMGSLTNDSSTIRKDQSFEMALTEYRGKVYGYSHTTFMVHDTLFYIVKRVKGSINGNVCEVKDDEIISCNFLSKHDKGVKQIYTFRLNTTDSVWRLDGEWKTNKTKNYYSISGSVKTATEKDISKSKLFPHLQELSLTNDVAGAFPPARKEAEPVKPARSEEPLLAKNDASENTRKTEKPSVKTETVVAVPKDVPKTTIEKEKQKEQSKPAINSAVVTHKETAKVNPVPEKEKQKEQTRPAIDPAVVTPKETAKLNPEPEKKKDEVITKKETAPTVSNPVAGNTVLKNDLPVRPIAALNVEKRKSVTMQTVDFVNDSLVLALYDNGEIDGDTVSVLINGDVVMANQGLRSSAIKKTIYITPAMKDSFMLVLYAENLGKYPPNTGLMIVRDGEDVYQVRFSADLQKNVGVIFRRKKK